VRRTAAIALLVSALAVAGGCGGDDEGKGGSEATSTDGTFAATTSTGGAPPPRPAPEGCRRVAAPRPRAERHLEKPTRALEPGKSYRLVLETSCGEFTIELDRKSAPKAAASLVSLARRGFYDGTGFHRVVPGFVVQGGDPTGTGSGGPGYTTVDRPPSGASYTTGVVAMAKAGDEPAGAAGSQFFVVTAPDAGLPPDYAIVGRVVRGMDVVERIGQLGVPATEKPRQPVVVEKVRVEEG
jgi:peptidyl-prolyl cis-trans isomerase B (cyclophilin B)